MKYCPYCRRGKPFRNSFVHLYIRLEKNKCKQCGFEIVDNINFSDFFEVIE